MDPVQLGCCQSVRRNVQPAITEFNFPGGIPRIRMEELCSVSSPRMILIFSQNRRASVTFLESDHRSPVGFSVSGDHGPKIADLYGFVGSITTVVSTVIFLVWAYVPEHWLHSIGIYYYPSRYWSLVASTYVVVTVVLAFGFYIGMNFMACPPPTSSNSMFDEFSREPGSEIASTDDDDQSIEPISDISITQMNDIMF